MFVGAVPKPVIEQITRVIPFGEWGDVFVGCSGSFRFDRAVKQRFPAVRVHGNDVSLLTCAIGTLVTKSDFPLRFTNRLAFVEELLGERAAFADRVAAVLVALEMSRYAGKSDHAQAHFRHYREAFDGVLGKAREKLARYLDGLVLEAFHAGDFLLQVPRAIEAGGGVVAFCPTYKGGYERLYRFVDDNTDWPAPDYGVWDPKNIEEWTLELDRAGVRYCVLSDQRFERLKPHTSYFGASNKPVHTYSNDGASSLRRDRRRSTPFRYDPVEASALRPDSRCEVVRAEGGMMNFLKDRYLAKGIDHTPGHLNFLVLIDGMLAGGFIYAKDKWGRQDEIYLLSDFSISRERRLSKLIAMLASGRQAVELFERAMVLRVKRLTTTAFTRKPVSMKYRGIYDLVGRKPVMLNYASAVREASFQAIYAEWFARHGRA